MDDDKPIIQEVTDAIVEAAAAAETAAKTVVKRARYGETVVEEDGEVEIVAFVGGGAR